MESLDFVFGLIILIMSVVIHEVSHGYAAFFMGDSTAKYEGRLTLNPLVHLDLFGSFILPLASYLFGGFIIGWAKPVPFNPYNLRKPRIGEALVALAGPLSNIFLAIIFSFLIMFSKIYLFNEAFISMASFVVFINISLALFNLIPIPPLDGSKILFSFLPYRWQSIREFIENFGFLFMLLFVLFIWQIISPLTMYLSRLLTGIAF